MSETTRPVNAVRMRKPHFLTLTGKPANQTAFKVIRAEGDEPMSVPHIQRKRVSRRSDALLEIKFEVGITEDEAKAVAVDYGFEGYTLVSEEDGSFTIRRADTPEGAETVVVRLSDTHSAVILKPISEEDASTVQRGIQVAGIDFSPEIFPEEADIKRWCEENSVDFSKCAVENGDQGTLVWRSEVTDADETRRIQVDDGVQFVVKRECYHDIPLGFTAVVNDTAYGSWGWGHLDFAASLADIEFCEMVSEGTRVLSRVLERILFYNDTPVLFRKELINNATSQFANYVGSLIDVLPTRVVIANRSSSTQEKTMKPTVTDKTQVTRTAPAVTDPAATTEPVAAAAATTPAVTEAEALRADLKTITDGLAALAQRMEAVAPTKTAEQIAEEEAAAEVAQRSDAESKITTVLAGVARSVADLTASTTALAEKVAALEGTTVMRSDDADDKQKANDVKDPFVGVFNRAARK